MTNTFCFQMLAKVRLVLEIGRSIKEIFISIQNKLPKAKLFQIETFLIPIIMFTVATKLKAVAINHYSPDFSLNKSLSTLISLINMTSRLPILKNSTLHKTKIHPTRLLISQIFPPSTPRLLDLCTSFFKKNPTLHVYSNLHVY